MTFVATTPSPLSLTPLGVVCQLKVNFCIIVFKTPPSYLSQSLLHTKQIQVIINNEEKTYIILHLYMSCFACFQLIPAFENTETLGDRILRCFVHHFELVQECFLS